METGFENVFIDGTDFGTGIPSGGGGYRGGGGGGVGGISAGGSGGGDISLPGGGSTSPPGGGSNPYFGGSGSSRTGDPVVGNPLIIRRVVPKNSQTVNLNPNYIGGTIQPSGVTVDQAI